MNGAPAGGFAFGGAAPAGGFAFGGGAPFGGAPAPAAPGGFTNANNGGAPAGGFAFGGGGGGGAPAGAGFAFGGAQAKPLGAPAFGGVAFGGAGVGGFGQQQPQQAPLFGGPAQPKPLAFGGPAPAQPNLFGGPQPAFGGNFGFPAGGGVGGFGQFGVQQPQEEDLYKTEGFNKFREIEKRYAPIRRVNANNRVVFEQDDPTNPQQQQTPNNLNEDCEFEFIWYQKQAPGTVHEMKGGWEQAEEDNPDPENLVPVRLLGIKQLKAKFDEQNNNAALFKDKFASGLHDSFKVADQAYKRTEARYEGLRRRQAQLYNRMLKLLSLVEVLRCHQRPLEQDEVLFHEHSDSLQAVMRPYKEKISELENKQEQQEHVTDEYVDVIEKHHLDEFYRVLKQQSEGIRHLTEMIGKDVRDVKIIREYMSNPR